MGSVSYDYCVLGNEMGGYPNFKAAQVGSGNYCLWKSIPVWNCPGKECQIHIFCSVNVLGMSCSGNIYIFWLVLPGLGGICLLHLRGHMRS